MFAAGYLFGFNPYLSLGLFAVALAIAVWPFILHHVYNSQDQEKLRHNAELEERVRLRTGELLEANQKLAAANQQLQILSTIDSLTELLNRRSFEEQFVHEWRLNARRKTPLAILMIDIDFFKHYNDSLGHLAGDTCLQTVARTLSGTLRRPTDKTARYGGEEFVVLLSDTVPSAAMAIAESLRLAIENLAIPHPDSAISRVVTISIGIACCTPSIDAKPLDILDLADKALYMAKHNGRNQVTDASGCHF